MSFSLSSNLTPKGYEYYLEGVSRSFSFCIAQLTSPLRQQIGLLYLFCRILDCIEDYPFKDEKRKWDQFDEFELFFKMNEKAKEKSSFRMSSQQNAQVLRWAQRFPNVLPQKERELVKATPLFLKDFFQMPLEIQEHFKNVIFEMSEGMQKYILKKHRLVDIYEVNEYCYYVAGVVGKGLTHLVSSHDLEFSVSEKVIKRSIEFGLFLQKVNLLKDQREDEKQGRFLVPHRNEVFLSALGNVHNAFLYIEEIPLQQESYRKFCAWSLFLGLASLPYIFESYEKNKEIKISRMTTKRLIQNISSKIHRPEALRHLYQSYLKPVEEIFCLNL